MRPGQIERHTYDYTRHGTTAALEIATGKVVDACKPRYRHTEFLAFLKQVAPPYPRVALHVVCDNYATCKHTTVTARLAHNSRMHLHFTPTSCSRLNLVGCFSPSSPARPSTGAPSPPSPISPPPSRLALRADLEARRLGYVLAIGCDRRVLTPAGPRRPDTLATGLPKAVWQRLSAGPGAKGQRYYDWALIKLTSSETTEQTSEHGGGQHWLLIRRHPHRGELAFYRCYSPTPVPLGVLVPIAGRRWTVEESFQASKGLAGLDEHQVRRWVSWRRWTLLAMLAYAFLAVIAATERAQHPPQTTMIALTCNEIRYLVAGMK